MKINVKHVAKLANLYISDKEEKLLENQLEETIHYIESLNEVNTVNTVGTNEVTDLKNVTREDLVKPSLSQEQALKNAKKTYNGFFVVPGIL